MVMIEARDASFTYPEAKKRGPALHDVSFTAHAGEVTFLLGPNGSGKSTLFKLILKLLAVQSGQITLDGRDVSSLSHRGLARRVAYIPQDQNVTFNYTVLDTVLTGRTALMGRWVNRVSAEDYAHAEAALESLGIAHLAARRLQELSGGERQLTYTARALCQGGQILLLDEPTSNLDFGNQESLYSPKYATLLRPDTSY